ncbi:MAG: hypothetical protein NPIRA02_35750 [Nitrospirales bacterium]|nr:MAG: hypothetical protein NPIRA02_35750 [Nitrospirales bacterium]
MDIESELNPENVQKISTILEQFDQSEVKAAVEGLTLEASTAESVFGDVLLERADLEPFGTEYITTIAALALGTEKDKSCHAKFIACLIKAGKKLDDCRKKAKGDKEKLKKCIDEHAEDLKKCIKAFEDCKKKK